MSFTLNRSANRGFTLTELLAVVAILVLLTTIAVPNILKARVKAALTTTEASTDNLATALELYRQAFGSYPGDVFPSEDVNNNGVLEGGEDVGVDIDGDATLDYALTANGTLDAGDGVVNIRDLEWALRTSARGGPFIDNFPTDGWGQDFVYTAPMTRPVNDGDFLFITSTTIISEDLNRNGILDTAEDIGIGAYATANADVEGTFVGKGAGAGNGVLDQGDDDNKDGAITFTDDNGLIGVRLLIDQWELGNLDISPDGYARNRGYYLYSIGIDGVDNSATGYEDVTGNNLHDIDLSVTPPLTAGATKRPNAAAFDESLTVVPTTDLDTGFEDTGIDGRANTHDATELDGIQDVNETMFNQDGIDAGGTVAAGVVDQYHTADLDIGGDDINSWNENRLWRQHAGYN